MAGSLHQRPAFHDGLPTDSELTAGNFGDRAASLMLAPPNLIPCGKLCGKTPQKCRITADLRDSSIPCNSGHRWTFLACVTQGEIELNNPERIIRLQAVKARCGLSRSTLYNRMAAGEFPTPISLGARSVGWVESEINAWITARINVSRNGETNQKSQAA
jgi:prophage regulatory protein